MIMGVVGALGVMSCVMRSIDVRKVFVVGLVLLSKVEDSLVRCLAVIWMKWLAAHIRMAVSSAQIQRAHS